MYSSQPFVGPPGSPSYCAGLITISGLVLFGMGLADSNNAVRIPCSVIGGLLLCLSCCLCAKSCGSSTRSQGAQGPFVALLGSYGAIAIDIKPSF